MKMSELIPAPEDISPRHKAQARLGIIRQTLKDRTLYHCVISTVAHVNSSANFEQGTIVNVYPGLDFMIGNAGYCLIVKMGNQQVDINVTEDNINILLRGDIVVNDKETEAMSLTVVAPLQIWAGKKMRWI